MHRVHRLTAALASLLGAVALGSCSSDSPTGPTFGPPAALLIEGGQDQSAVVGAELTTALTAKVVDTNGRPVRGQAVNFRIVSGGGSVFAGVAITSDSGIARERWTLGTSVADSQRVEARAVDATGNAIVFGVFRATARPDVPASVLKVAGDSQTVVVGTPASDSLTVRVVDRFGNPVPQATVRWVVMSGGGSIGSDSTVTNALGVARTSWVVGHQVGTAQQVTAAVGSLPAQTFQATVQAAAAVGIAVVTPAAGAASGAPFVTPPRVRLVDAFGNTTAGANAMTLSVSDAGTLLGTTTVTPSAGEATFAGAGLSGVVGEYSLAYAATGLTPATQQITLGPGAPAALVVATQPAGAVSGAAFTTQPVLELRDDAGNRTISTASVTASVASGGGTVLGSAAVADAAGVATFTDLRIDLAASHTLRFTLTEPALTVTSAPVEVQPGSAAQLGIITSAAGALIGAAFTAQPVIEVRDAAGNRTESSVVVTLSAGEGGSVTGTATATAVAGRASFTDAGLGGIIREHTLTFSAAGLSAATQTVALGVVPTVVVGFDHTMILKTDGTLWAAGRNTSGQLGDGTLVDRATPAQVMTGVRAVAGGAYHTMMLKSDGTLWAAGRNDFGQLGDGSTTDRLTPVQVMSEVQAVAGGGLHTLILKTDGTLWMTGWNNSGQLGDGTLVDRATPAQVMTGVRAVVGGGFHSMIVKTDGTLWATGGNGAGQLGDGTTTNRAIPVQVMTDVQSVAANFLHTMILKTDGSAWGTGRNSTGHLGDGTTTNRSTPVQVMIGVQALAAGGSHSTILKTDGTLWTTGGNTYGQLGDGTLVDRATPAQVMTGVRAVAAGWSHTVFFKTDGSLWTTGRNNYGQLGDGTTIDRPTPAQILP